MVIEPSFLISSYFLDYILPFILVFTLIFAILEKTKLLGDEKKQVNAIIGLILIGTPFARDIVVKLMPFLVIFAVILLVFMLLYGFIEGKKDGDILSKGLKITFGILLGIALIITLLFITGGWDKIFQSSSGSTLLINGIVIVAIA